MTGKEHANLLGIFAYVFAGIQSLITLFFGLYVLLMGGVGLAIALGGNPEDVGGIVMMFLFAAIFGVFFAMGLVSVIMNIKMGRRLRSGTPPSKRSVMITSIMNCVALYSMPLGGALGGYGMWFANSDSGKRYFEGVPEVQPVHLNPQPAQTYAQPYTPEHEPYRWR